MISAAPSRFIYEKPDANEGLQPHPPAMLLNNFKADGAVR